MPDADEPSDLCLGEIPFAARSAKVVADVFKHDPLSGGEAVVLVCVYIGAHDSQNENP